MTKPYWAVVSQLFEASWMAVLVVPGLFRVLWVVLGLSESSWMGVLGLCVLFSSLPSLLFFSLLLGQHYNQPKLHPKVY